MSQDGIPSVSSGGSDRVHSCICQRVDRVGWRSRASWDESVAGSETMTNLIVVFYKTLTNQSWFYNYRLVFRLATRAVMAKWSGKSTDWSHAKQCRMDVNPLDSCCDAILRWPNPPSLCHHCGAAKWAMNIMLTNGKVNFTHRLEQQHNSVVTPGFIHWHGPEKGVHGVVQSQETFKHRLVCSLIFASQHNEWTPNILDRVLALSV